MVHKVYSITGKIAELALENGTDFARFQPGKRRQVIDLEAVRSLIDKGLYKWCSLEVWTRHRQNYEDWTVGVDDSRTDYVTFSAPELSELNQMKDLRAALTLTKKSTGPIKEIPAAIVNSLIKAIEINNLKEIERLAPIGANGSVGKRPLNEAAKAGRIDILELLLPHCDANAVSDEYSPATALMDAVNSNQLECAKWLLKNSDPKAGNLNGDTALMAAAVKNDRKMVDLLLPVSDANARNSKGGTALMQAAKYRRLDCLLALLPVSNPDLKNEEGNSAFFVVSHACRKDSSHSRSLMAVDCLSALASVTDSKATDAEGNTMLSSMAAMSLGYPERELFKILLSTCDATHANSKGNTALMIGVSQPEIVELLLPFCDPDHKNDEGETALMIAARQGSADSVRLLVSKANANLKDKVGNTALMMSLDGMSNANRTHINFFRIALRLIPISEVDAQNSLGETPLMKSTRTDNLELFELMLPRANVDLQNVKGETALMLIPPRENEAFFELLAPISNVNIQDQNGRTALMNFPSYSTARMEKLIRLSNVDLHDKDGMTALMIAALDGNREAVDMLLEFCDARLTNFKGQTAQKLAREANNEDVAVKISRVEDIQNEQRALSVLIPDKPKKTAIKPKKIAIKPTAPRIRRGL